MVKNHATGSTSEYDKESFYYQGTTQLNDRFTLKSRLYRDTFENTLMMYNSLADLKNKKGSYSHYSDYSDGAGLQLAADVRENDLLSFAVNWKDDVHREKGAPHAAYDRYEDRTGRSPVNINGLLPIMSMSWLESAMTGAIA